MGIVSGPWTTCEAAPATTTEVKLAANLIIVTAFDDFVSVGGVTVPPDLNHFLEDVTGSEVVSDASFSSSKTWLDLTGTIAHYINPVISVMARECNVTLTPGTVYTWRTKLTAPCKR